MPEPARYTCTGLLLALVFPFPSSPDSFPPQHIAAPPVVTAHVWLNPAEIDFADRLGTVTGWVLSVFVPLPSSPVVLLPQHWTVPPVSRAHVWSNPADTSTAVPAKPVTFTGESSSLLAPLPISPCLPWPQHFTPPPFVTPHVWSQPAEICVITLSPVSWGVRCGRLLPLPALP